MYQVNFSEQSMKELNQLEITKQMEIADIISSITKEHLAHLMKNYDHFIVMGLFTIVFVRMIFVFTLN